jgi:hypothetical protein
MTKIEEKSNEEPGIVITFWKVCATGLLLKDVFKGISMK